MKKITSIKLLLIFFFSSGSLLHAQFPARAMVGYYESWSGSIKLSDVHPNYNVINLAFAVNKVGSSCEIEYTFPWIYNTKNEFLNELDLLHSQSKVVLLSIGGANADIALETENDKNAFVASLKAIFADYYYKIDGLDIDIEGSSVQGDAGPWSMTTPSNRQKYLIEGIKAVMADYQLHAGKKMCLTMAPEVAYVQGGLSDYQVSSINGGWYLPLIQGLRTELDMLNCQLYNVYGEAYAIDGGLHMEGTGNFIVAMVETAIVGFDLKASKGQYAGLPAEKVGFGTVGTNTCAAYDFSSYVDTAEIIKAVKYLRGKIAKPSGWQYTALAVHPKLKGMMVWSIQKDYDDNGTGGCDKGPWTNAASFSNAFPAADNVSVDEKSYLTDFNIFPNPASDIAYVQSNFATQIPATIINSLGVEVARINLHEGMNSISVSDLSSGIYWLKSELGAQKIVVQ